MESESGNVITTFLPLNKARSEVRYIEGCNFGSMRTIGTVRHKEYKIFCWAAEQSMKIWTT